jgi:hypothetical protein
MSDLSGPAVVAAMVSAGVSGVISLVGLLVNRSTTIRVSRERFDFEKTLAEQKQSAELQLAERKFQYDRDLHDHKRRVELAEEVLADFYRFADIIRAVRSPGGFRDESASRPRTESETPAEATKLDAYFVPIARVARQSDFFSDVRSKRYRSRALLGPSIDEAFTALDQAVWEVQSKAMMLSDMVKRGGAAFNLHTDVVEQYESTIWQHMPGDDPVEPIVRRAIEVAEATCRPILERKQ